jgi:site-specific DNA-methyltransferase (adenine-specific)
LQDLFVPIADPVLAQFPSTQSGSGAVKRASSRDRDGNVGAAYGKESRPEGTAMISYGDEGSAARFYEQYTYRCYTCQDQGVVGYDYGESEVCPDCGGHCNDASPFENQTVFYNAKATAKDRAGSRHPTVKPIDLMRSLARHVTPPGGTVLDAFAGTGTTGVAARIEGFNALLIEGNDKYVVDIERRFGIRTPAYDYLEMLGYSCG